MNNPATKTEAPSLDLFGTAGALLLLRLTPQSQTAHYTEALTLLKLLRSSGCGSCSGWNTRVLPRLYNLYVHSSFMRQSTDTTALMKSDQEICPWPVSHLCPLHGPRAHDPRCS